MMKRSALMLAMVSGVAIAIADDGRNDQQVRVRVINALPGSGAVSVTLGAEQIFSGIGPGHISPYKVIRERDDARLVVTTADGRQIRPTDDDELDDDDEDYTILVMPTGPGNAAPRVKVIDIDDDKPDDGKAHINLLNASSAIDEVEMGVDDNRIFSGVDWGDLAGPNLVEAGTRTITVNASAGQKPLWSSQTGIEANKTYTVVVFSDQQVAVVDDLAPMGAPDGGVGTGTTPAGERTSGTRRYSPSLPTAAPL